jgi:peptide chain release factor 3
MTSLIEEIALRRTFAIISHPDAGKTTITEKLLLFGGAIQQAGAIKSKKTTRHTTSDWMEMEKTRGVSIATSVMCFEYKDKIINLLDTPGHADFSEDTYRTLTAVDSVLMVIDSVKGVESRTKKLMDVCRLRNIPVITFINKLDREGKDPFELLDDIEQNLNITAIPLSWPISMGKTFQGVYNIADKQFLSFKPGAKTFLTATIGDPRNIPNMQDEYKDKLIQDLAMIEGALDAFDLKRFLAGKMTPVFFGSAINNFGVHELLENIIKLAPPPQPQMTEEREVRPEEAKLAGIVFKIHANMNPKHRDRIAFMRINSGKFFRGMKLINIRLDKEKKVPDPITFMAQTRTLIEEAYPGDIVGIHDTGTIKIGDTFTEGEKLHFTGIPSFAPETFRRVINRNTGKTKQLNKGLQQLSEEGAVQLFKTIFDNTLILGAVGELQFEVVQYRVKTEYGAECDFVDYPRAFAYWLGADDPKELKKLQAERPSKIALDTDQKLIYFFEGQWELHHVRELFPKIKLFRTSECKEIDLV